MSRTRVQFDQPTSFTQDVSLCARVSQIPVNKVLKGLELCDLVASQGVMVSALTTYIAREEHLDNHDASVYLQALIDETTNSKTVFHTGEKRHMV